MFDSFLESARSCPVVKLGGYAELNGISSDLYAYLDFGGLTGTYMDALCSDMLAICRERGELSPKGAVIQACNGSFAVSLASACALQGHQLYLVMPADTPSSRQEEIRSFGAKLSLCAGNLSALSQRAKQAASELGAYYLNYLSNDANCEHHRRVTGPMIMRQCPSPSAIVVGVGSGGTVSGVGESVKAWNPDCKIIAVEPYESRAISGGIIGRHNITGIGFGFIPDNYNPYIVDKVIAVPAFAAAAAAKEAQRYDGVPASIACGAVLCAAKAISEQIADMKSIVCVFPSRFQI